MILNNTENKLTITMDTKSEQSEYDINFEKMNLKELKSFCREHKIKGYSKKKKCELISDIIDNKR